MATPILKVALLPAPISSLFTTLAMDVQISQLLWQQSPQVHFPLFLVGKLKRRRTFTGSAANPSHATAIAMHFPANAGLIFSLTS
jgi:hypothetical protein